MSSHTAQGIYAESIFIVECLKRNLKLSQPIADLYGYDFIIETSNGFKKVQVKSSKKPCRKNSYNMSVNRGFNARPYDDGDFDYVACYLIQHDLWYIIPFHLVKGKRSIRLFPSATRSRYNGYQSNFDCLK